MSCWKLVDDHFAIWTECRCRNGKVAGGCGSNGQVQKCFLERSKLRIECVSQSQNKSLRDDLSAHFCNSRHKHNFTSSIQPSLEHVQAYHPVSQVTMFPSRYSCNLYRHYTTVWQKTKAIAHPFRAWFWCLTTQIFSISKLCTRSLCFCRRTKGLKLLWEMTEVNTSNGDISKVLEFWREFDLDGKRLALDKQVGLKCLSCLVFSFCVNCILVFGN